MVKKGDKSFWHDKAHGATEAQEVEDDLKKPLEPYKCTGNFQTDFAELCKRTDLVVIPPIIARPHRPIIKAAASTHESKPKSGRGNDKRKQSEPTVEPEAETEPAVDGELPPKTYTTRDKFDYFKPCVQVETDRQDTATEIFIRGWQIDDPMLNVLKQCWTKSNKLHTISLWHTGLTDESIELLAEFLPDCKALKRLNLDNNPVKSQNYFLLLREGCSLQLLSLRYNRITNMGAKQLGWRIGTSTYQHKTLGSLNLNGNQIGDEGACGLADGLRTNTNLLSLNLAQNQITDVGAKRFGEVLSHYPINHEEVVQRRKHRGVSEVKSARSRIETSSIQSNQASQKRDASIKKGDGKEKQQKRDSSAKKGDAKQKGQKRGDSAKKGALNRQYSRALLMSESKNESVPSDSEISLREDGTAMLLGNKTLVSLNLANNELGEEGLKSLLQAVEFQSQQYHDLPDKLSSKGLLRLIVNKNQVPRHNETLQKINSQMLTKDPFFTPRPSSTISTAKSGRRK